MQILKLVVVVVVEEVVVVNSLHFSRELGRRSSASLGYHHLILKKREREKRFRWLLGALPTSLIF